MLHITLVMRDEIEAEFRLLLARITAGGEAIGDDQLASLCFQNGLVTLQSQMAQLERFGRDRQGGGRV